MTRDEFLAFMERHYRAIVEINKRKGHDYAGDSDALSNFKEEAAESGITPFQVWSVFANKHHRAVKTFVREGAVQSEPIEGRIHDEILYLFLLLGLIEDLKPSLAAPEVAQHSDAPIPPVVGGVKTDFEEVPQAEDQPAQPAPETHAGLQV